MVIDYHERKQVSKNRPKKRPVNFIFIFVATLILAIYSLGVATGWFLYKIRKSNPVGTPDKVAAAAKQKTGDAAPPADNQLNQHDSNGKISDPHLTFYDALPRGEVTALGSGLNPAPVNRRPASQKEEQQHKTISSGQNNEKHEQAAVAAPSAGSAGAKDSPAADKSDKTSASIKPEASAKKYTVQAASCSVRKDAEAVKEALDRKGLLSFIVESEIPGKGTWFRVRLGNHLDLETANKIAAKVGNNAIVIPE
jgi:hypothetical protein